MYQAHNNRALDEDEPDETINPIPVEDLLTKADGYVKVGGLLIHQDILYQAQSHERQIRRECRREIDKEYKKVFPRPKSKAAESLVPAKTFYTYEDAAFIFGKSVAAIKQHVYRGELTPITCLGRKGFHKSDLDKIIQASKNSTGRRC